MCGIAGFWFKDSAPESARKWLRDSAKSLHHRGPDDSGLWFDGAVGFGHTRLSILDLSPLGHQPMASRDGRWVMAFNGEVYNFREIRKDLERLNHSFAGTSDSEVVIEAFAEWGPAAVRRFIGMFAMVLWSKTDRKLYLLRDRLGVKPLYYGWNGDSLWFGSELKALRAFRHWTPRLDPAAMADYFRYGYVAEPRSIYQDIFKLRAGHRLELGPDGVPKVEPYWSVLRSDLNPRQAGENELADELEALMIDAFRYRMISDVPVGVFLSGGIDSSTVAAILQRHGGQRIKTFTIGFDEAAYDESPHAEQVAQYLGTEHTTRILKLSEAMRILPKWGDLYDEPFGDDSGIPTLLVSQVASESVKVVLSADGRDASPADRPDRQHARNTTLARRDQSLSAPSSHCAIRQDSRPPPDAHHGRDVRSSVGVLVSRRIAAFARMGRKPGSLELRHLPRRGRRKALSVGSSSLPAGGHPDQSRSRDYGRQHRGTRTSSRPSTG